MRVWLGLLAVISALLLSVTNLPAVAAAVEPATTPPALVSQDGQIVRTVTAGGYPCDLGTGIAFDGSRLLLSCHRNGTITAVSPTDGHFITSYNIAGLSSIGALAYDRNRDIIWACGGFSGDDTRVWRIDLKTSSATLQFDGDVGCPDGLAYDGLDDTLWLSPDVSPTIYHYALDGTRIASFPAKLGGCGNSGIAVGGSRLFLANNGCEQIYSTTRDDPTATVLFGHYPARLEDMECDDVSFSGQGQSVIWSKDAYDGILNAFAMDSGACGYGGSSPDRDGDGLLDEWETRGYDYNHDGTVDIDLPAMGASPDHRDLFVEADWMTTPRSCKLFSWWCTGGTSFAPRTEALGDVVDAFAVAPVDAKHPAAGVGIVLHIDGGPDSEMDPLKGEKWGARSRANNVGYNAVPVSGGSWVEYNKIQKANFDEARRDVFHYAMYADTYNKAPHGEGSSGIARVTDAVFEGDSFLIAAGAFPDGMSRRQEAGTFMHEFGHTLGLKHGGGDSEQHKPNYLSIMNYLFQFGGRPLDYSVRKLDDLNEASMNEQSSFSGGDSVITSWVCPKGRSSVWNGAYEPPRFNIDRGIAWAIGTNRFDWDCSGGIESGLAARNVNWFVNDEHRDSTSTLSGFDDWANLVYDGGAVGALGAGDPKDEDPDPTTSSQTEATVAEFKDSGLFGDPGDGGVSVPTPTVLFAGAQDQSLLVDVTNTGSAQATYRIAATGLPIKQSFVEVTIPGDGMQTVAIPLKAEELVAGSANVTVTLSPPTGESVDTTSATVTIADLKDPATRSEAQQLAQLLTQPQPDVPESVRAAVADTLTQIAPGYVPVAPVRAADSRVGQPAPYPVAKQQIPAGGILELPLAGQHALPADASAAVLNVTVAGPKTAGHVTVYPCDATRPLASSLNFVPGQIVPNAVLSGMSTNGKVCLYSSSQADLIVDVNGYFPKSG